MLLISWRVPCFGFYTVEIWICFGFRDSDFEFLTTANSSRKSFTWIGENLNLALTEVSFFHQLIRLIEAPSWFSRWSMFW
jgi:hypothetical protein